ncbi:MAG: YeeE/YedE family protein [bacterium]|nr:YeeE/YedE family protein [bacterium]
MNRDTPFVLLAGLLFGAGLALSTMIQPEVVLSFLRFEDLGLLLVLGGAVTVTFLTFRVAPKLLEKPLVGGTFDRHTTRIGTNTFLGAALFGIGWGLCGVCPAPAFAGLGVGNWMLGLALIGLLLGAWVHGRFLTKT